MDSALIEAIARRYCEKMGRNPDDWKGAWNLVAEFLALMEAYEEVRAKNG